MDMHMHHLFGILFIGWSLSRNMYGSEMVFSIIQGEITSPIMNGAEFLENLQKPKKELAMTLKKVFMVVFILVRIFACFPSMVMIQLSDDDIFFKLIPTGLWVLSMKWVWMMLNKSSKLLHKVKIDPD
jgi:hypothetical protein